MKYVKTGVFDRGFSKAVDGAFRLREKADYDDFYVVAASDAEEQIKKADIILTEVEAHLEERWRIL